MRGREAGSSKATLSSIAARTSDGTFAIGHGGGGVFSITGSATGIRSLANEATSSGVETAGAALDEWWAVFGTVDDELDGFAPETCKVDGGKCFLLYV